MAIQLPSNFNLPAPAYIDRRMGLALSTNDLRNWDFTANPIPVGFEVCVDGKWYTYQGQGSDVEIDTLTGYFKERGGINVVQEIGSSTTNVMSQAAVTQSLISLNDLIQQLVEKVGVIFEINKVDVIDSNGQVATNGNELYERGTNVVPYFAWKSYYNGNEVIPSREPNSGGDTAYGATVSYIERKDNGEWSEPQTAPGTIIYPGTGDEDQYLTRFQGANSITRDTIFTVSLYYGSGVNQLIASLEVSYTFVNKKYWGYTNNVDLNISNIIEEFLSENNSNGMINVILGSELSLSRELSLTEFNCNYRVVDNEEVEIGESVYPIYIVPSDIYTNTRFVSNDSINKDIRLLVGDIEVNTYSIYYGTAGNGTINYRVILFNVPQRGILNIEVKNYE